MLAYFYHSLIFYFKPKLALYLYVYKSLIIFIYVYKINFYLSDYIKKKKKKKIVKKLGSSVQMQGSELATLEVAG